MRKRILSILYYMCFVAALLLILYRMYLRSNNRNEESETIQWIALVLVIVALICRLIPRIFPTLLNDESTGKKTEVQTHNE